MILGLTVIMAGILWGLSIIWAMASSGLVQARCDVSSGSACYSFADAGTLVILGIFALVLLVSIMYAVVRIRHDRKAEQSIEERSIE